jgi:Rieske Fe-S protein
MTNSYITSDEVARQITNYELQIENIYSPTRNALFCSPIEVASNVAVIAGTFINNLLNVDAKRLDRIKNGQGAVIRYKGHRVGASRDDNGKLHLIHAVCSHMGCGLKWNKDERTFDCPCHGSRFDVNGNVVNSPASKGIEYYHTNNDDSSS